MTKNVVKQTNIYNIQGSRKCINTNIKEMEQLLGLQMLKLMSIIRLPSYGKRVTEQMSSLLLKFKYCEFKTVRGFTAILTCQ